MIEKRLYKQMTMKDLIRTMEKLRTQVIDDRRILFPLTKKQRGIYEPLACGYLCRYKMGRDFRLLTFLICFN